MDCTLFFSKYNQQLALSSYKIIYISGVKSDKKYRSFLLHSFYIKYEKNKWNTICEILGTTEKYVLRCNENF